MYADRVPRLPGGLYRFERPSEPRSSPRPQCRRAIYTRPRRGCRAPVKRRIILALVSALALIGCVSGCSPSFNWIGATSAGFDGTAQRAVPNAAQDLAVSSSGYATTGAPWVETSYDQRAYMPDGTPFGPCPANSSGRFRENGLGPRGVAADNGFFYAAQGRNLVRWSRATFLSTDRCDGGTPLGQTLAIGGSGTLIGLSVGNGELYVTDSGQSGDIVTSPATTKIEVYNADLSGGLKRSWTVPNARQSAVDREGNLWVLQQRTNTTSAKLSRYSPQGALLTSFAVTGEPMDVAADPTADRVWIPDNGQNQDVEAYDYSGQQVATLGRSYLSGPTPGELGPLRFAGPRGVAVDGQGDIYVTQTCNPGRGAQGWTDDGYCMILSKYSNGAQQWRVEDDLHGDTGEPAPGESNLYTQATILNGDRVVAVTIDPWTYPNDPRMSDGQIGFGPTGNAQVQDVNGTRLVLTVQNGFNARVFEAQGDILVPVASFTNDNYPQDAAIAPNGDVYRVTQDNDTFRFPWNGSSYGAPIDLGKVPGFVDTRRIDIEGSDMLVTGCATASCNNIPFTNYPTGDRVEKFSSLPRSAFPSPAWTIRLQNSGSPTNVAVGAPAIDDNVSCCFAIGFDADSNNWAFVRIYSMDDGSELTEIHWPQQIGGSGLYDQTRPLAVVDNVIYAEEDFVGKINTVGIGP